MQQRRLQVAPGLGIPGLLLLRGDTCLTLGLDHGHPAEQAIGEEMFLDGPVLQIAVDHHPGSGKGVIALGRFDTPPIERDDIGVDVLDHTKRRFEDNFVETLDRTAGPDDVGRPILLLVEDAQRHRDVGRLAGHLATHVKRHQPEQVEHAGDKLVEPGNSSPAR